MNLDLIPAPVKAGAAILSIVFLIALGFLIGHWEASSSAAIKISQVEQQLADCKLDKERLQSAINVQNAQIDSLKREADSAKAMAQTAQDDAAKARETADQRISAMEKSKATTCVQAAEAVRGLL